MTETSIPSAEAIPFKAETRQLLEILIHSLYTEREVFLRELISNAADALTRLQFEMLTNRDVLDPDAELAISIIFNKDEKTLTIRDNGIGMNADELVENLGTIAHSGARAFLDALKETKGSVSEIIGQFGVGFYSAFMVAEWIQVTSRSFRPGDTAANWFSSGEDTYRVVPADKADRGTEVIIKLKDDAVEFADEHRLHSIISRHSEFIPFPIYLGDSKTQANQKAALWRKMPREVEENEYEAFYRQLTLEPEPPLAQVHLAVDAPYQIYAILFVPASPEHSIFSSRKDNGIKLFARKVLIQEYNKDLLPEYLRFVQGVVDSEDIPLNVSRETVQSNRMLQQIKKVLTGKLVETLKTLGTDKPEKFESFWNQYGQFIKEGIATDTENAEALYPLLRFHTMNAPEKWQSLSDYVSAMKPDQKKIYYLLGDDGRTVANSPHLEVFRKLGYDVLFLTEPLDPFMLLRLTRFQELDLANAAKENLQAPTEDYGESAASDESATDDALLVERFKRVLGERVKDVRTTSRLVESPARLVDAEDAPNAEVQRVYRMLKRDYEIPLKVIEINPTHPLLKKLAQLPEGEPRGDRIIEQVFENALLIEGLHPNPADMIARIQQLMEDALK